MAPRMRGLFFRAGPRGVPEYVPSRYKDAKGGRGSTKSWGMAGMAAILGAMQPTRVLCARELQTSMRQSIHKLLANRIEELGLLRYYDVQAEAIIGKYKTRVHARYKNTEFQFAGIKSDPAKIKGFEEPDICLIEEAENVSRESYRQLTPTIRNASGTSEIWVSFNPRRQEDPSSQMFIERPTRFMRGVWMNWSDNPWFPADLEIERQSYLDRIADARDDSERAQAQADYEHVWEGAYERLTDSAVIRHWIADEVFADPHPDANITIKYGGDWGFANDPTCLIRFWITEHGDQTKDGWQELWISHEAYGYHTELDDIPALYDTVPGSRQWPIKADCSAPATISHVRGKGFNIDGAEKWPGSVEDGVRHVNRFRVIHIHERCPHIKREARLYSYKVDRVTQQVLPLILDANNHGWDSVRYGLDGHIQRGGSMGTWMRIAEQETKPENES